MRIISQADKTKYLCALRGRMEYWYDFGRPRFSGLVLGNFIYITSHAGYEWDRRVNNQKSRAIGFVTECGEGCKVSVITTRGFLDPVSILLWYLFAVGIFSIKGIRPGLELVMHIAAVVCALLIGISSFAADAFTERGQNNMDDLLTLLRDPVQHREDAETEMK